MAFLKTSKRWPLVTAGALALGALAAVGGPYLYIHVVEGKAPAPLKVGAAASAATPANAASGARASLEGTWTVTNGSQAGYRVKEELLGQSHEAVGRTSSVTGRITMAGGQVRDGTITVDLTTVRSDEARRDRQFQGRIMDTAQYPTATFALSQPVQLSSDPADGVDVRVPVTGKLTLHGTTRPVTVTVTARRTGGAIQVSGSVPVTFAEWGIPNPSFAGFVTTEDHGVLEFLLTLSPA